MALDFTLLTAEQIWGGDNGAPPLQVLQKYGTAVAPTDLTVLLGGRMTIAGWRTSENDLTCSAWSRSQYKFYGIPSCVDFAGDLITSSSYAEEHHYSVRPILPPSETVTLTPTSRKTGVKGVEIVEYGEYPQTVADEKTSQELREALRAHTLILTGKKYTFAASLGKDFYPHECPECEYKGKKYICIAGTPYNDNSRLSSGEKAANSFYWVEVQPIEWLVDSTGTWVSKKALIAGIPFSTEERYDGDFSKIFMKQYLDTYFAKEVEPSELESEKKRRKALTGLSARLEEAISDKSVEAIKKRFKAAENGKKTQTPPDRLEEAARMQRLMNARNILIHAAQQAYDAGDKALLDGIVDLSQHYEMLYNARKRRVASLQARRRFQRKQGVR